MKPAPLYIAALLLGGLVAILLFNREKPTTPLPPVPRLTEIDRIVVLKSKRRMMVYAKGKLLKTYRIALGSKPVGDKIKRGDRRTPEGTFHIRIRNANSKYYRSLGIDYPNIDDARRGLRAGLIDRSTHDLIVEAIDNSEAPPQNTALGGDIYIHGNGAHRDWTWGCVALEDADMKELFDAVPSGTEVEIRK